MRSFTIAILLSAASAAQAAEPAASPETMIAQCDAPIASAIDAAAASQVHSAEWNNLNMAIASHRRRCSMAMALSCHVSDAPERCYSDLVTELDARMEVDRLRLVAFRDGGGSLMGALPEMAARTAEMRAAERNERCDWDTSEAGVAVGPLGGNVKAACRVDAALAQWSSLAFGVAGMEPPPLLPPQ